MLRTALFLLREGHSRTYDEGRAPPVIPHLDTASAVDDLHSLLRVNGQGRATCLQHVKKGKKVVGRGEEIFVEETRRVLDHGRVDHNDINAHS